MGPHHSGLPLSDLVKNIPVWGSKMWVPKIGGRTLPVYGFGTRRPYTRIKPHDAEPQDSELQMWDPANQIIAWRPNMWGPEMANPMILEYADFGYSHIGLLMRSPANHRLAWAPKN